jgi:hypothetical protein
MKLTKGKIRAFTKRALKDRGVDAKIVSIEWIGVRSKEKTVAAFTSTLLSTPATGSPFDETESRNRLEQGPHGKPSDAPVPHRSLARRQVVSEVGWLETGRD